MTIELFVLMEIQYDDVKSENDYVWQVTAKGKTVRIAVSACSIDTENKVITMPEWMAVDKGLV